ncbi:DNA polymerase type-X family protein pol4 [Trichoderma asperellum]|uniref:DNA polymerase n=1 Tax=Trichoderma asperellum TaxID=101201 RepID=A0A6V8R6S9_TRIAP|nr:DNA polymerase type-X family protein pol4 [Trichoderma asperellum]
MAPELPRIFLLPTHLQEDERRKLEDKIPTLTHDSQEAAVILGKISRPERALFELRRLRLATEPVASEEAAAEVGHSSNRERDDDTQELPSKRRRLSGSKALEPRNESSGDVALDDVLRQPRDVVLVLKLAWLLDSLEQEVALPADDYLLYRGRKLPSQPKKDTTPKTSPSRQRMKGHSHAASRASSVLARAAEDQQRISTSPHSPQAARRRTDSPGTPSGRKRAEPPTLYRETTSEHDAPLPPIPDFLHTTYSCERPSLVNPPNAAFIKELKAVQIERLPGCGAKIAKLYQQWATDGCTEETKAAAADTELTVLRKFYDIWGVADVTARHFFKKGWRDLDDIVEHEWSSLSRAQQIGVKYYDEFQLKIPRAETEAIANTILTHVRRIDPGFQMVIVGSYRRGKPESGDVDVILSHPDEAQTLDVVEKLIYSLEKSSFIKHTLSVWTRNSERGQAPLPWRGQNRSAGSGFDTLDKAMVVWQEPRDGKEEGTTATAPHRRVDIIISPWKTAGCAILGWSGETTFQRDLRRYCKVKMGLKFDSSGIRRRADGSWVDLESSEQGPAPDMETAERRVFEGLGLEWRPPAERCTG